MTHESPTAWSDTETRHVEDELEKEYAEVSRAEIRMVVRHAQSAVPPAEGRVKLLAVARRKLSPCLERAWSEPSQRRAS